MTLRARLVTVVIVLVSTAVTAVSAYFVVRHKQDLETTSEARLSSMREELSSKGRALATSMALSCERAIVMSDFLFLREVVNKTVSADKEFVYGIIMSRERQAHVHTDAAKVFTTLDDAAAQFAASQRALAEQSTTYKGKPAIEIVQPIVVGEGVWGTLRLGLALERVNKAMEQYRQEMSAQLRTDIVAIVVVALLLMSVASFFGVVAATRLARPLRVLLDGVEKITSGDLGTRVDPGKATVEIDNLANGFNTMSTAIKERDVALRQNMEELAAALEAANEASRVKSEFVASISHELRTPLNAVVNIPTSLLEQIKPMLVWQCPKCQAQFAPDEDAVGRAEDGKLEEPCPDCDVPMDLGEIQQEVDLDKHVRFLAMLQTSGRHLLSVVNDLLDFSKLEAGKLKLVPAELLVGEVLEEVEATMGGLATDKALTLDFINEDAQQKLVADRVKLAQIFINLLGNAVKFTPEGGKVTVRVEREARADETYVRIAVTDTGIGIPNSRLDAVFESFRQVDGSHTRQHGGTGLGLAITKRLVELHGGEILVASTVGEGSTFTVVLPEKGQTGEAVAPTRRKLEPQVDEIDRRRLLVIDDDEIQLQITKMVLQREGFEVSTLAEPARALDTIAELKPDAILLDVMMPGISGLEILKSVKASEATAPIPVFICTAYHSNKGPAQKLGGIWLPKPWSATEMVVQIRDGLADANSYQPTA